MYCNYCEKKMCHSQRGNKSLYKHKRALDKKAFSIDIALSQLWLATFQLQYIDYLAMLKTVNIVLSSVPPFALYCCEMRIHTEYTFSYRDMCNIGNVNAVSRSKKA